MVDEYFGSARGQLVGPWAIAVAFAENEIAVKTPTISGLPITRADFNRFIKTP
jgi:hypothetical protein